jgi:DMSO/TMAO reductase YedYZ molybdopterin-dependent catalytic subunit
MSTASVVNKAQIGLILRALEPLNLEFPFHQLDSFLTPNHLFYVRSHFPVPRLERAGFSLNIDGAVNSPFTIGLEELKAMPSVTRPATLECAGNARIFLVPPVKGVQWELGAVSTAEWTGVPLSALLEKAGVESGACEIVFEAADSGTPAEEPVPPGATKYARSIPMSKAGDALIAYRMNGEEISPDHGFPLRAIVPGHYGMASVKWLTKIRVVTAPFPGYFQTSDYASWEDDAGNPVRRPLAVMALKSAIARPRTHEFISAGTDYKIYGAAWGGDATVAAVEVTTDGGKTWSAARFLDEAQPFVWRRWELEWKVPTEKGTYVLKSRAIDAKGKRQAVDHDKRCGTYVIDHTLEIEVIVR